MVNAMLRTFSIIGLLIFFFPALSVGEENPVLKVVQEYNQIDTDYSNGTINAGERKRKLLLLRAKAINASHKESFAPGEDRFTGFPHNVKIQKHRNVELDPSLCQGDPDCLTFVDIHDGNIQ